MFWPTLTYKLGEGAGVVRHFLNSIFDKLPAPRFRSYSHRNEFNLLARGKSSWKSQVIIPTKKHLSGSPCIVLVTDSTNKKSQFSMPVWKILLLIKECLWSGCNYTWKPRHSNRKRMWQISTVNHVSWFIQKPVFLKSILVFISLMFYFL